MIQLIENLVAQIFYFLDCCLKDTVVKNIIVPEGLELKGIAEFERSSIHIKVKDWSQGIKYLEFKVLEQPGLYIRLNKSHFNFETETVTVNSLEAFSFYHRKRKPGRKHAKMTLICHLINEGLGDRVQQHLNSIPISNVLDEVTDETYTASQSTIPTLEEFLPTYQSIMYLENSVTYEIRVQLIENQFSSFFKIPVNQIRGAELIEFTNPFKRTRTAVEIQEGASPYKVEESTMKGYIGGIRGLLKRASTYSHHPFDLCDSLYCKALEFNIDNESDRYLTLEEVANLINCLADRDKNNFKKSNNSKFSDYLTPLIILFLSTGLRPKYALKLKWSHVEFEKNQLIIKGDKGKIKSNKISDLSDEAVLVLKEWKKHIIHKNSSNNWVFPSPQNMEKHLTSYKTAFTTFRKTYNVKWFVMYDMRHTFATHFTSAYQNIHTTQDALHHASQRSTKRYNRHLSSDRKEGTAALAEKLPSVAPVL
jgi:integrase